MPTVESIEKRLSSIPAPSPKLDSNMFRESIYWLMLQARSYGHHVELANQCFEELELQPDECPACDEAERLYSQYVQDLTERQRAQAVKREEPVEPLTPEDKPIISIAGVTHGLRRA